MFALWYWCLIGDLKEKQHISPVDSAEGQGEGDLEATGDWTSLEEEADAGVSTFVLEGTSW